MDLPAFALLVLVNPNVADAGAYRLFANLVSLDAQEWSEFVEGR